MIFKTSIDRKIKDSEITKIIGESYGIFEKIRLGIYGSPKYKIIDVYPENIGVRDRKNNDLLNCNFEINTSGMFVWAKLPDGISSVSFIDKLLKDYNLFIAPGNIFGSNGEGYIRFSLCAPEEIIKEAIKRVI